MTELPSTTPELVSRNDIPDWQINCHSFRDCDHASLLITLCSLAGTDAPALHLCDYAVSAHAISDHAISDYALIKRTLWISNLNPNVVPIDRQMRPALSTPRRRIGWHDRRHLLRNTRLRNRRMNRRRRWLPPTLISRKRDHWDCSAFNPL